MRVAWRTVGAIIERVLPRHQSGDRLDGLTHIGVDELSYRRHHEYVTVVVDHVRGGVVWASPGKNADTFKAFFKELGKERCAQLEAVTLDMSAAYLKAVTEESPQARIIFDRFHVQRLAHDALDAVRREQVREAAPEDKRDLKNTRFALQKSIHCTDPRSRREATAGADSRSWTDAQPAAGFSCAADAGGTVMCPRASESSPSTSRARVAAQYLGASSRYRS